MPAELVEPFEDLMPSLREVVDQGTGDTGQVRDPVPNLTPLQTECGGEVVAELGLVEVAGGLRQRVEVSGVERAPMAFGAAGQVRDQHMGMEMGVAGAAGPMPEPRRDEPVTGRGVDPAGAAANDARVAVPAIRARRRPRDRAPHGPGR